MSTENHGDDVTVLELIKPLWGYKWLLLIFPVVVGVLAALWVSFAVHPTWEASAVLQIGQVGGQVNAKGEQMSIEPIVNVIERMKSPSFTKTVLEKSGFDASEIKANMGYLGGLKVTKIKDAELIEVKVRGPSPDTAQELLVAAITTVQKVQSEMAAPIIERKQQELKLLLNYIQETSAEMKVLKSKLLADHNWNAFDATLSASVLKNKTDEYRALTQNKLALESQLGPTGTYPTQIIDKVYVSEGPVSPKKKLIVGLAMLVGLLGAVLIAYVHHAISSKKLAN